MRHYKKHIDNLFKEKLGNYRETPPPEAWDELEARLDGLTPAAPGFSYRWLLHVAIISGLAFLSISLGRKMMANNPAENNLTSQNTSAINNSTVTAAQTPAAVAVTPASPSSQQAIAMADEHQGNTSTAGQPAASQTTGPNTAATTPAITASPAAAVKNNSRTASVKNNFRPASGKQLLPANKVVAYNSNNNDPVNLFTTGSTSAGNRSTLSNPSPDNDASENTNSSIQAASPNTTLSVVTDAATQADKKQPGKEQSTGTASAQASRTRTQPSPFPRLEIGFKTGYEGGFSADAANKFVVSPYLQYNLCSHLSVMTQPGVKLAVTPNKTLANGNYYDANPEDMQVTAGAQSGYTIGTTTYHVAPYTFTQKYDSIVKTNRIGGASMQFELPVLLKYKLTKKLSVYGGVNFTYNKFTSITENTVTVKGTRNATIIDTTTGNPTQPNFAFSYTGSPIADYKKLTANQSGYTLSTGYMIGFSYACSKKWLFDALVEQSPAPKDVKAGYNINSPLSLPYFRLSIGYKILDK